jgi:hypothetical protein
MIVLNIGFLTVIAMGVWWLTGIDKTPGGESKRDQHLARAIRCALVLFLAAILLWLAESDAGYAGVPLLMIIPVSIALLLRSSISEFFAHGFLRLIDPMLHDDRPIDIGKSRRYLDTIGHLIRNGHRDDAIKLCEELKQSGEVDIMTLEMTLEFLGVKQQRTRNQTPLHEAAQLRTQKKFTEAEQLLKSLLLKNPSDVDAALMLVRLYAQDLREPGRVHEVLRALEQQPHPPASHIEFARRSIGEWGRSQPGIEAVAEPKAESVDELLEQKLFGSAIELLENQIKAQPQDFDLRLKLAEVQAVRCENFQTAEKIIRQMEVDQDFSREQIERARFKLKEWRGAPLPRK